MNKELALKVAFAAINGDKNTWDMNIDKFDWHQGVALHGIWKVYKATGERKLLDFLVSWADKHIEEAFEKKSVNSTCPLLTVAFLAEETGNMHYLEVCTQIAEYIINDAPLTREGALEHTVVEDCNFSEQMWADTVFMACLFLAKLGTLTERKYSDFAVEQLKLHIKYLMDKKDNLCYHAWNCALQNHMSAVYWARANAWIIYTSTEFLKMLGDFEGCSEIKDAVRRLAAAYKKHARSDGAFCTVLDDPQSYDEASATAGIIAGILQAVELHLAGEEFEEMCEKGIKYLESVTKPNGEVMHVSTGTPVVKNKEEYKAIMRTMPALYGQGLMCAALCADKEGLFEKER